MIVSEKRHNSSQHAALSRQNPDGVPQHGKHDCANAR
jgi:hypothetical protein